MWERAATRHTHGLLRSGSLAANPRPCACTAAALGPCPSKVIERTTRGQKSAETGSAPRNPLQLTFTSRATPTPAPAARTTLRSLRALKLLEAAGAASAPVFRPCRQRLPGWTQFAAVSTASTTLSSLGSCLRACDRSNLTRPTSRSAKNDQHRAHERTRCPRVEFVCSVCFGLDDGRTIGEL